VPEKKKAEAKKKAKEKKKESRDDLLSFSLDLRSRMVLT